METNGNKPPEILFTVMTQQKNNKQPEGEVLNRAQVCKMLGRHRVSIQRYEKEGLIKPAFKIKNRPYYTVESLAGLIDLQNKPNEQTHF